MKTVNTTGDVYAFSDLHGNYKLFKQIQKFLKPNDIAVCLGDICDRDSDGIEIMQEIFKDERFKCLLGNHEAMLIDAVEKCSVDGYFKPEELSRSDVEILRHNGTMVTLRKFFKLSKEEQTDLFQTLITLPTLALHKTKDRKEIWLSHAGANPEVIWESKAKSDEQLLYWDRKHIALEKWDELNYPDMYIVHGHTPVQALCYYNKEFRYKPISHNVQKYCGGHKIDIDLGTPTTKRIALINLEDFKVKYFEENELENC